MLERERKFLIRHVPTDVADDRLQIAQIYPDIMRLIDTSPAIADEMAAALKMDRLDLQTLFVHGAEIRVRRTTDMTGHVSYTVGVKGAANLGSDGNLERPEREEPLPADLGEKLWDHGPEIGTEKTRYLHKGIEIDVFGGPLSGLVVAEVEDTSVTDETWDALFALEPSDEVTSDARFRNRELANLSLLDIYRLLAECYPDGNTRLAIAHDGQVHYYLCAGVYGVDEQPEIDASLELFRSGAAADFGFARGHLANMQFKAPQDDVDLHPLPRMTSLVRDGARVRL